MEVKDPSLCPKCENYHNRHKENIVNFIMLNTQCV